jgi:hypothetical protein
MRETYCSKFRPVRGGHVLRNGVSFEASAPHLDFERTEDRNGGVSEEGDFN